jgi:phospholipase/carboxylesterase
MPADPEPTLLFLHGRYGVRDDLACIAERTPPPWRPALLQGPVPLGERFEWFEVSFDDPRGALSRDVQPAADHLLAWIDENVGDAPVAAVGWSQGGATALQALRRAPERLAFVVTLGGFTTVDGERGAEDALSFIAARTADLLPER